MARGGKGGHTSHRQPSRPHAGDRRLAGLVRRSVRPGEVPTMGGAATTGRATGAGKQRKGARISEIKGAKLPIHGDLKIRGKSQSSSEAKDVLRQTEISKELSRTRGVMHKLQQRLKQPSSPGKKREIGKMHRSLIQRLRELNPTGGSTKK